MGTAMQPICIAAKPKRHRSRRSSKGPEERRANRRYELELEFEMYLLRGARESLWCGLGSTRNWSRSSILVRCDRMPPADATVQLNVRWSPGVQLVVVARVVQIEKRGLVLRIVRRRFRGRPMLGGSPRLSQFDSAEQAGYGRQ